MKEMSVRAWKVAVFYLAHLPDTQDQINKILKKIKNKDDDVRIQVNIDDQTIAAAIKATFRVNVAKGPKRAREQLDEL